MNKPYAHSGQVRPHDFANIPTEMRGYRQWVSWKIEFRGGKPTKVPYSSVFQTHASVTDPASWASFDETVGAYEAGFGEGIGFVFTDDDPFAGIDLDDASGDEATIRRQGAIFDAFAGTYVELSPSGKGAHIIVRGSVAKGRRRSKVEVYSSERFFTMTGNVYRAAPIIDCNTMLQTLWAEMGPTEANVAIDVGFDRPETRTDDQVRNAMFSATNAGKAIDLHEGRWQQYYSSQSEGDFALLNIIAFHTDSRAQVARIFEASSLYRPDKYDRRPDLLAREIGRSFDQKVPHHNADWIADELKKLVGAQSEGHTIASGEALPIIDASEFAGKAVPEREWHVFGFIPARTVTAIYGDGGDGKSQLAVQLLASTILAMPWVGMPVRRGTALYITAEDEFDEVHRRLRGIGALNGFELGQLQGLAISSLADRDAILAAAEGRSGVMKPTALYLALATRIAFQRPSLLILDNLADVFGGNENDRAHARQFIALLRSLAITYDMAVVILAHPSRDGINSGRGDGASTAWHNSVRSRLFLRREIPETDPDVRVLEVRKSNYGAKGKQIWMRWDRGVFIPIAHADSEASHKEATAQAVDELFLSLLDEFTHRGQELSPAPTSPAKYAPKLFAAHPRNNGTNKYGFAGAMNRLMSDGRIREERRGPPSKSSTVIVRVPVPAPSGSPSGPISRGASYPTDYPAESFQLPFQPPSSFSP